jgi:hypothetical protein
MLPRKWAVRPWVPWRKVSQQKLKDEDLVSWRNDLSPGMMKTIVVGLQRTTVNT